MVDTVWRPAQKKSRDPITETQQQQQQQQPQREKERSFTILPEIRRRQARREQAVGVILFYTLNQNGRLEY